MLIWFLREPSRLVVSVLEAIKAERNDALVSAATAWEIAIKAGLGKITFPVERLPEMLASTGFDPLAIDQRHALAAGTLPRHHSDPFDRMLIAQAKVERLVLVSADPVMARYDVELLGRP